MASAQIGPSGNGGRRRSLEADINLVPFIDLLSMCICFLLMTAVWTQLSTVQVKQANGTEGAAPAKKSLDLDAKYVSSERMTLTLKQSGRNVKTIEVANISALETSIRSLRAGIKADEEISAVMVTPREDVDYEALVNTLDVFRKNKLVNIGVVPVSVSTTAGG